MASSLRYEDYTIGWICALQVEVLAARFMLDEKHEGLFPPKHGDDNDYVAGSIGGHNVIIVSLPKKSTGTVSAASLASQMRQSFPNLRYSLMVGIGAGVPGRHLKPDIRLGDVVVGTPGDDSDDAQGVIGYEFGKETVDGFVKKGWLYPTDPRLRNAFVRIQTEAEFSRSHSFLQYLDAFRTKPNGQKFLHPGVENDQLYEAKKLKEPADGTDKLIARDPRDSQDPVVHYGLIASGDKLIKNAKLRDELRDKYKVICFEMEAAGLMNTLPVAVIRGISDYADSHKNDLWHPYAAATAAAYAKGLLCVIGPEPSNHSWRREQVESLKDAQKDWRLSEEERNCIHMFGRSEYEEHKARNPSRVDGTCQWFLQNPKFRNWQESKTSSLLWVSADPGCGKSVLAKSLVDRELASTMSRTTCYFFFKDDDVDQKSTTKALTALLHQLFSHNSALVKYAIPEFRHSGANLFQLFGKLWNILTRAAADPKVGEVICVLDALDECEESSRFKLIDALNQLYHNAAVSKSDNTVLKFLITSRPYFDIERGFAELTSSFPTIRLAGEEETELIKREIDIVISFRVQKIATKLMLDDSEQLSLKGDLLNITHRTYLWLKLIFEVIEQRLSVTKKRLRGIVGTIPDTLDRAYEAILERSKDKEQAMKILHIIVSAVRPLTLREMNVALAIEEGSRSQQDLDLEREDRFRTTVRNVCGLFVSVIDSRIYLIHQTAKEFLIRNPIQLQSPGILKHSLLPKDSNLILGNSWKHCLDPVTSNFILARICIWYLLFDLFDRQPLIISSEIDRGQQTEDYIMTHDFLDYAAKYWAIHFRRSDSQGELTLLHSVLKLYETRSGRASTWFQIYWTTISHLPRCPQDCTMLMLASCFAHKAVVKLLLQEGADVTAQDSEGWTALHWAAWEGHGGAWEGHEAVQPLLNAGADVSVWDKRGMTPLHWAAADGQEAIVRLLLDAHSIIDAQDSEGCTALHLAAANGHEDVVRLLTDMNADIEVEDEKGEMALHMAAANGYGGVVRLLLDKGANIEAKVGSAGQGDISSCLDNISTERQQSPEYTLQYSDEHSLITSGKRSDPAQSGLDDGLGRSQARPIVLEEDEQDNATA